MYLLFIPIDVLCLKKNMQVKCRILEANLSSDETHTGVIVCLRK